MNKLGQVTGVTVDDEEKKVYVDVAMSPTEFEEGIRFRTPGVGVWFIPEEGDIVQVDQLGKNRAVAFSPYNVPDFGMPTGLSEGDIAFKLNENTTMLFQENNGSYDITIECDGDLTLDGSNIFVGENGSPVATADHTHDYSWTDAGGNGTTSTENENPTNTQIE